nr:MAG TPA: signaling protein [Caudoviricetes sp.]
MAQGIGADNQYRTATTTVAQCHLNMTDTIPFGKLCCSRKSICNSYLIYSC